MCGIVAAVAQRNVQEILLEGLKRLEYRGYDSAPPAKPDAKRAEKVRTRFSFKLVRAHIQITQLECTYIVLGLRGLDKWNLDNHLVKRSELIN